MSLGETMFCGGGGLSQAGGRFSREEWERSVLYQVLSWPLMWFRLHPHWYPRIGKDPRCLRRGGSKAGSELSHLHLLRPQIWRGTRTMDSVEGHPRVANNT